MAQGIDDEVQEDALERQAVGDDLQLLVDVDPDVRHVLDSCGRRDLVEQFAQ